MKQYKDQGLTLPIVAGSVAMDDALLKSFGDEAMGAISSSGYTADLDTPSNKKFVEGMAADYGNVPGTSTLPASIQRHGGGSGAGEDRAQDRRQGSLHAAMRGVSGDRHAARVVPLRSILFGNVVGNVDFAAASARTASSSTRRSRPTRTSASSGPSTRSWSWRSWSTARLSAAQGLSIRRSRRRIAAHGIALAAGGNSIAFGGLLFLLSAGFPPSSG